MACSNAPVRTDHSRTVCGQSHHHHQQPRTLACTHTHLIKRPGCNDVPGVVVRHAKYKVRVALQRAQTSRLRVPPTPHLAPSAAVAHSAATRTVATSQIRTVMSSDAVAMFKPSGDHDTSLIPRLWPVRRATTCQVSVRQRITVLSIATGKAVTIIASAETSHRRTSCGQQLRIRRKR